MFVALNGGMNDELERVWKETAIDKSAIIPK
jgi:hypothetical protein